LDGRPIEPARAYRVTVPAFLASGGDSFTSLRDGTERTEGPIDVDGLTAYLGKVSSATVPLGPLAGRRIEGDGCQ
jgi:5'-nucleotidase